MKIAFLTPEYPHSSTGSTGGIGTSIKNLAAGLLAQGCTVRVLVYGQTKDAFFEDNGILIQQIKNVKLKGLSWLLTRKKLQRVINELYHKKEIDLVEAPDWTGITSFIRTKCPIVIRLHGSDTYFCHLDGRPVKWVNKFHEKRALQNANALLSVSQFTADLTNQLFGLVRRFTVIPNSIDTDSFANNNNNNNNNNNKTILYFGSLIRKKGLLELPLIFNEVIKTNPDVKLVLVGKDVPDIISGHVSTWGMMQEFFTPKALENVSYLGSVPYQEIQKYISEAALCVFPSFAEALPLSWLEAMAMQKSIVASNIGWATEIIDDGVNGFLVHPTNHKEYAMRIVTLLNDTNLMLTCGKSALSKVEEKFRINVISKKNIELYNSLIKNKK
jgi:glycosyltransferase involved in cell wall biosynthesis